MRSVDCKLRVATIRELSRLWSVAYAKSKEVSKVPLYGAIDAWDSICSRESQGANTVSTFCHVAFSCWKQSLARLSLVMARKAWALVTAVVGPISLSWEVA